MTSPVESVYNWYRQIIRNPKYRWWVILGTLLYLFSPIDIAPDFIPIVGQLDDLVLATLLVTELSQVLLDRIKKNEPADAPQATVASKPVDVDVEAVSVNE